MATKTTHRRAVSVPPTITNRIWCIGTSCLSLMAAAGFGPLFERSAQRDNDDDQPDEIDARGVAVIKVRGLLLKRRRDAGSYEAFDSYERLGTVITRAMANPAVKGVLLDIDSPGGEVSGLSDLCDLVYSLRGVKPLRAAVNDEAYSGAYALASSCSDVYVSRDAGCGSVGSHMLHQDRSALDKNIGVTFNYIVAGKYKVEGNVHEPLSSHARDTMQERVDDVYLAMCSLIARNRDLPIADVCSHESGSFFSQRALDAGLADQIGNLDEARLELGDRLSLSGSDSVDPWDDDDVFEDMEF
jgi:signal peptide peptidase SppA